MQTAFTLFNTLQRTGEVEMIKVYSQADSLAHQGLNILIYGDPGIGKTTLANTAPNPLVLDFDRGSHRASHRRGNVVQFDSYQDIISSQKELTELIAKHESVVIDTAGTMIELMQMYLQTSQPALARNGIKLWGETKKLFAEFFAPLKLSGKNVIFIAHAKEKEEGDFRIKRPLVQGGSYDLLMQSCDLVGYYTTVNNKRILTFDLSDTVTAKNCAGIEPVLIQEVDSMGGTLENIIKHTHESLVKRSKEQEEAISLVSEWMQKAITAKDANKFMQEMAKANLQASIKKAVWAGVQQTFNSRGLTYNVESKLWEGAQ
jgi:DNA polymerase III delta prime subunit